MFRNLIVVFLCFFSCSLFAVDVDLGSVDSRLGSCSRNAIASNINSWVNDSSKMPSSTKVGSYNQLYKALQGCGVFKSDINPSDRDIELIFGRSYSFDNSGHLSLNTPDGKRITYQVKKENGKFAVSEIYQETDRRDSMRLFGENMTDDEKKKVLQSLVQDCRMANPVVLDIIDRHTSGWIKSGLIPDWNNGHQGYEKLFNELKSKGVFATDTVYKHFIFGRSATFNSNQYGLPHLAINVDGSRYEYKIDAEKKQLNRPPACDNTKMVKLNGLLAKFNTENSNGRTSEQSGAVR